MSQSRHIEVLAERMRAYPRGRSEAVRSPSAQATVPRLLQNRYRPLARIGSGALGQIYAASDEGGPQLEHEVRVAVQLLDGDIADDGPFVDQLRRGFAALRANPHPNIVKILDFGSDGELHFAVMELLDGASAQFVLKDATALPAADAEAIIRGVGDALQYLHANSIVHGRVAPDNVFITFNYDVKLLDIVPAGGGAVPANTAARDSANAPDARLDVFGLSCLAYELLAGKHPFNACSPAEARRSGLRPAPIESLSQRRWTALARGLELDPDYRTPSVSALLRDFGIVGTERLRPPAPSVIDEEPAAPDTGRDQREPDSVAPRRLEAAVPPRRAATASHRRSWAGPLLAMLAVVVIAAGLAWMYYPPLREVAADRFGLELALIGDRGARPEGNSGPEPATDTPEVAAAPDESTAADETVAPNSAITREDARASGETALETSLETSLDRGAAIEQGAQSADETAAAAGFEDRAPDESTQSESPASDTLDAGQPQAPELEISPERVAISEQTAFVSITIRRTGDVSAPQSIVWWTGQETAEAETDYVAFGPTTETFAADEDTLTLLVPLVNDGLPEPQEQFSVHAGRQSAPVGNPVPLASARITIVDDD